MTRSYEEERKQSFLLSQTAMDMLLYLSRLGIVYDARTTRSAGAPSADPVVTVGDPIGIILVGLYKESEDLCWMYLAALLVDYRNDDVMSPEGSRVTLSDILYGHLGSWLTYYLSDAEVKEFLAKAAIEVPKFYSGDQLSVNDR